MLVLKGRRNGGDLIAFAPGGRALAVRSETGLQLWRDLSPGAKPTVFPDLRGVGYLRFTPDGGQLYVDGHCHGVLDVAGGDFTPFPDAPGYRFLALSADGESVVAVHMPPTGGSRIDYWPVRKLFTGSPRWRIKLTRPFAGRSHPLADGRILLEEGEDGGRAAPRKYRYVLRSGETGRIESESAPADWFSEREAVSTCGRWVAGQRKNRITVWSLADLAAPPVEWQNDTKKIFTDVAFHPSSRFLAVTCNDETVRLHDSATWQVARTFTWDLGKMKGIAFSPDGTLAAAGSDTGRIVIWDVDV